MKGVYPIKCGKYSVRYRDSNNTVMPTHLHAPPQGIKNTDYSVIYQAINIHRGILPDTSGIHLDYFMLPPAGGRIESEAD